LPSKVNSLINPKYPDMSSKSNRISYSDTINKTLDYLLTTDDKVLLIGQGVKSPWYVGSTCNGLADKFGEERIIDTPISENGMTGAAVGSSIVGMKPIIVHPRMDFMLYAFDPIINQAANWSYMSGGKSHASVVIWAIINRGGEQAAQHSQALYSIFAHIPGLKVITPSTPYDVKGLLISAVMDPDPVVFVDDRWLYNQTGEVPEEEYTIPIGKGVIRREGKDVSLISFSHTMNIAASAAATLAKEGIDVELVDLRSIKPYDKELLESTIKKTGRAVIVDGSWKTGSFSAEISAFLSEHAFSDLKSPIIRICLPDAPAPASSALEKNYYISSDRIVDTIRKLCNSKK
jgi:acetoin:2,6-dichlorophenolindophenol oxidoreductase subunit beta